VFCASDQDDGLTRGMPAAPVMLYACGLRRWRNGKRVYDRALALIGTGRQRPSWTGCVLPWRCGHGYRRACSVPLDWTA